MLELETRNGEVSAEKQSLLVQIEYYREQFVGLVENSSSDARNEIKKRLKETTELELRVNSLSSENARLARENEALRLAIHDGKATRQNKVQANSELESRNRYLSDRLKALEQGRTELVN